MVSVFLFYAFDHAVSSGGFLKNCSGKVFKFLVIWHYSQGYTVRPKDIIFQKVHDKKILQIEIFYTKMV